MCDGVCGGCWCDPDCEHHDVAEVQVEDVSKYENIFESITAEQLEHREVARWLAEFDARICGNSTC